MPTSPELADAPLGSRTSLSLRAALLEALQTHRDRPFLVDQGKVITYRRVRDLSFAFLAWLSTRNVPPGCSVALLRGGAGTGDAPGTESLQRLIAALALLIGNHVLIEKPTPLTRIILYKEDGLDPAQDQLQSPAAANHPQAGNRQPPQPRRRRLPNGLPVPRDWLRSVREGLDLPAILRAHPRQRKPDAPCLIACSSGTTGVPKRIPITEAQLLQRAHRLLQAEASEEGDVLWYNMQGLTNQSLLYLIVTILRGGTLTPTISQATHHILSPAMFLLKGEELRQTATTNGERPYKEVKVVGSAVSPPLFEKLSQCYQRVRVSYGSTEVGPIASKLVSTVAELEGVGTVYPDIAVEIRDDNQQPLPPGCEGEVTLQSDSAVSSYLKNHELTAKAFRDGWFFPGDRGLINAAGELCIVGRSSDMFNIGGVKINAAQQDGILLACQHVQDAMVFTQAGAHGLPLLSALVVLDPDVERAEAMAIFAAAYRARGDNFARIPLHFYFVAAIPRNENGKPMRQQAETVISAITPVTLRDFGHDLIPLGPFSAPLQSAQH
ncbi:MAG: class I adenylate-forming enzyme family protein [Cyanobium sp.]